MLGLQALSLKSNAQYRTQMQSKCCVPGSVDMTLFTDDQHTSTEPKPEQMIITSDNYMILPPPYL